MELKGIDRVAAAIKSKLTGKTTAIAAPAPASEARLVSTVRHSRIMGIRPLRRAEAAFAR